MRRMRKPYLQLCIAFPAHMDSLMIARMMKMKSGNLEQIRMKMGLEGKASLLPLLGGYLLQEPSFSKQGFDGKKKMLLPA